jgi:hypothetical protein
MLESSDASQTVPVVVGGEAGSARAGQAAPGSRQVHRQHGQGLRARREHAIHKLKREMGAAR